MEIVNSSLVKIKDNYCMLDANCGFSKIPLKENFHKLTTFVTPWGRY